MMEEQCVRPSDYQNAIKHFAKLFCCLKDRMSSLKTSPFADVSDKIIPDLLFHPRGI
jgi:hypothetical protein